MSSRRSEAREKAAQLHKQQVAAAKRRRITMISSIAVVAVVVVLGLVFIALRGGSSGTAVTAKGPSGLVDGAILSGQAAAPVTVTVYEDLQCPACKQFEASSGATLDELKASGDVKVLSRPLAFLDRASTTKYSSRALNALACVQDTKPDVVPAYKKALFAQQPAENTAGLPDEKLVSIAKDAGAADISTCLKDKPFGDWVTQTTANDLKTISGTPTVLVDGKKLDDTSPAGLKAAVAAAKSGPKK